MNGKRRGFSLIEMLLAASILLVSVGILFELAGVGQHHARSAEAAATAQRICQNVLEEMLCGALPLETCEDKVSEDPAWTYTVAIEPLDQLEGVTGLAKLRVTVTEVTEEDRPAKSFSLTRWIRYPASAENGETAGTAATGTATTGPAALPGPGRPERGGPRP